MDKSVEMRMESVRKGRKVEEKFTCIGMGQRNGGKGMERGDCGVSWTVKGVGWVYMSRNGAIGNQWVTEEEVGIRIAYGIGVRVVPVDGKHHGRLSPARQDARRATPEDKYEGAATCEPIGSGSGADKIREG